MAKAIEFDGLKELADKLEKLDLWVSNDIIRNAVKEAAELVTDEARDLAPNRTGKLFRAIRTRAGRGGKGRITFLASASSRWFSGETYYGAFQEFGWKSGRRYSRKAKANKAGKIYTEKQQTSHHRRKQNPGEHFMQRAFESKGRQALDVMQQALLKGLEREASK